MDKSRREKESLCNWQLDESERQFKHFEKIDKEQKSYFISKGEGNYLMEYDFETLPELKKILNGLWSDESYLQSILKVVLVAAMKNKPQIVNKKLTEEKIKDEVQSSHTEDKLPAFIYNF